jgi:glucoamylase
VKYDPVKRNNHAPGAPGISPRWSSSAKSGIGKAMEATSDVSFTISHGIVNEVFYPWEDEAGIRDMGFIVTGGADFFSEEKNDATHIIKMVSLGVPAYVLTNTCREKRYRIDKEIISDPIRNTLLQRIRFRALKGRINEYALYLLLAPHLGNQGAENTGWIGDYKGVPMLFARRGNRALALACSLPWVKRSAGFVGISDGWEDIHQHKEMTWEYQYAENGNIGLTAQIDLEKTAGRFIIALGFGHNEYEAAYSARGSLLGGYREIREKFIAEWRNWQKRLPNSKSSGNTVGKLFRISASVLRMHEANRVPGAIIASMSIPWGETRGDEDTGGYHMVWPRDLVESSGGLLALQAKEDTLRILIYLMTTQEADGHWVQNMWLQGRPHWEGIQMDQTALPILLIDLFRQHGALKQEKLHRYWITVKKALAYLVQNGPYTEQDRWERDGGLSIFTVATEVAALLAGADFADINEAPEIAAYCRETADCWNEHIDEWLYVAGTSLAKKTGVEGYYIRINHNGIPGKELQDLYIRVKNRPEGKCHILANEMISPDALALVRFGLRAPDDPRIRDTIKVIDQQLKVETPNGPCWHRYTNDGYGEHEDGSPYDGTGIGRAWPLLTGERAHYEIAAGNMEQAAELTKSMEAFANNGLFPEQIWDTVDIPEKELYFGKHSGSAMPLVWAHAEYIKLCSSLKRGKVFDMPEQTQQRYIRQKKRSFLEIWRQDHPLDAINKHRILRIETRKEALIHWSSDDWETIRDTPTRDSGLGVYFVDFTEKEITGNAILFTFYWKNTAKWENKDYEVRFL